MAYEYTDAAEEYVSLELEGEKMAQYSTPKPGYKNYPTIMNKKNFERGTVAPNLVKISKKYLN